MNETNYVAAECLPDCVFFVTSLSFLYYEHVGSSVLVFLVLFHLPCVALPLDMALVPRRGNTIQSISLVKCVHGIGATALY